MVNPLLSPLGEGAGGLFLSNTFEGGVFEGGV